MAKFQSPLLGYNNNVRHRNRVFHVQTEDSGVKHPHIITHLFMDGGRILKSIKKSYAEFVGTDDMQATVQAMMKEQHKAMLIALRDGQFDYVFDEGKPAEVRAKGAADSPKDAAKPREADAKKPADKSPSPPAARATPAAVRPKSKPDEAPETTRTPPPAQAQPAQATAAGSELTLDIDALERAAKDAETTSPMFQQSGHGLPPPPQNLFRREPITGAYRALGADPGRPASNPPGRPRAATPAPGSNRNPAPGQPAQRQTRPQLPASSSSSSQAKAPQRPAAAASPGRYAPARPASIFGQSRPNAPSGFGDDLISDKSLDEVILSYLAEDLEPGEKKR
jgi:hypothetical protein